MGCLEVVWKHSPPVRYAVDERVETSQLRNNYILKLLKELQESYDNVLKYRSLTFTVETKGRKLP